MQWCCDTELLGWLLKVWNGVLQFWKSRDLALDASSVCVRMCVRWGGGNE